MHPLITLSSDFGPGNIGCGAMEAVIYGICPSAKIIHFCHTIPGFDIKDGARTLEGVAKIPKGFHVCIVDPGVGTKRKAILIETKRGDILLGPDNGVLRPAAEFLGGIVGVFELTEKKYQNEIFSPIFHGRDIFSPAVAHLANGISPESFGPRLDVKILAAAPYAEALWGGDQIACEVIHINENGSLFLNIREEEFEKKLRLAEILEISFRDQKISVPYQETFGEAALGKPAILNDDFGRVELAINQGNFAFTFDVKRGEKIVIRRKMS